MNIIFFGLFAIGILCAFMNNETEITNMILTSAGDTVTRVIGLVGIICFWTGFSKIAEKSGLFVKMSRAFYPIFKILFPTVPKDSPAVAYIMTNLSANLFGFGSAATPFGLKAMEALKELEPHTKEATRAMCTFLAINTSSVTLIPTTVLAMRLQAGSMDPSSILGTTLFATMISTMTAILLDRYFAYRRSKRGEFL